MLDIIYLILIFIVGSISIQISTGIFIMPYLLYLTNKKSLKSLVLLVSTAIIFALQTDRILEILLFFIFYYFLFSQILKYLHYTYMNVLFLSLLEQGLWILIFEKNVDFIGVLISFVFYNIFNLFFIKMYKKTEAGVVK